LPQKEETLVKVEKRSGKRGAGGHMFRRGWPIKGWILGCGEGLRKEEGLKKGWGNGSG